VVLGFVTNRLNVSITGMEASAGMRYVPKWTEIAVTGAIIAAGFALFGMAAKYLPIFPAEAPVKPEELARESVGKAVLSHAGD
jgi:Ni/Fe-hydrogenase subunit HybB-like protein